MVQRVLLLIAVVLLILANLNKCQVNYVNVVDPTTDLECYEVCIEAGGDPEFCEESLMIGGN